MSKKDDKQVIIPYNLKNKLICEQDVTNILAKYDIYVQINDISIYQTALTHKSYIVRNFNFTNEMLKDCYDYTDNVVQLQDKSYERLELYGDRVIDKLVIKYLMNRYPNDNEGFMTTLKTKLVDCASLSVFAREIGLTDFILISKQVENIDNGTGRASVSFRNILEDVFEAFIGALDLDVGEDVCDKLIIMLLETNVDFADLLYNDTNYKNQLQEYYHKMKWGHPIYEELIEDTADRRKSFTMCIYKDGQLIGKGTGNKKKYGEQYAAKEALHYFGLLDEDINKVDVVNESVFI